MMDPLQSIFHEKQEGSLCAQHCLNALLQGHYFTAVDLADIAKQLDETERQHMAEAGVQTEEYRQFMEQPSSNFDDSGFFSVQVIAKALRVWSLDLLAFNSQDEVSVQARADVTRQKAFICNFREHWFSVRKLGFQWFNLNSLLTGPELISDTYLAMFLTQLQQEGYSLFIVIGDLPSCDAEEILKAIPAEQPVKPRLIDEKQASTSKQRETTTQHRDEELQRAIAESRHLVESDDKVLQKMLAMSKAADEERLLQRALQLSMEDGVRNNVKSRLSGEGACASSAEADQDGGSCSMTADQLRQKRLAYLDRQSAEGPGQSDAASHSNTCTASTSKQIVKEPSEEELLEVAIRMSMDQP